VEVIRKKQGEGGAFILLGARIWAVAGRKSYFTKAARKKCFRNQGSRSNVQKKSCGAFGVNEPRVSVKRINSERVLFSKGPQIRTGTGAFVLKKNFS